MFDKNGQIPLLIVNFYLPKGRRCRVALRDSLNAGHPGANANYSLVLKLLMLGIVPLKALLPRPWFVPRMWDTFH